MNNIDTNEWIELKSIEVSQPIGTFYIATIGAADLVNISYSDIRRLEAREVETYLGIERPLNKDRVKELMQYVATVDATFPSSIILAIESENTKYDKESCTLTIKNNQNVAKILDGQHRIAGLQNFSNGKFELIVSIFIDMDIADQAMVFATINLEQTKVNKSLAYDLYEYTHHRSPQKTAHEIVKLLDKKEGSPFAGKIKILGTAGNPNEIISQASFVDSLLPMISNNPIDDRDQLKRGKTPIRATVTEERSLIFRNLFIDKKDADIAKILWNYFGAVEDKWQEYWRDVKPGYVLNRTTGFRALMRFLPFAYLSIAKPGDVPERARFNEIFNRIQLKGDAITPENFPPGASGQSQLRKMLCSQAGLE
jgi:DGQHR domain-containing protein